MDLAQAEKTLFAALADSTRGLWEANGYNVHVQTNNRRVVITPKRKERKEGNAT